MAVGWYGSSSVCQGMELRRSAERRWWMVAKGEEGVRWSSGIRRYRNAVG